MRRFSRMFAAVCFALVFATLLDSTSLAQTQEPSKPVASKKQPPASPSEKPTESAIKPEPAAEPRPAPREAAASDKDKEKEEHYDVSETAPAVTHHQISVDGKLLKYSATAGRLPIKRGDGRIEAEK